MAKKYFLLVVLLLAYLVTPAQMRSVVITPDNATILPGESVPLTATGATFYLWSPATGLSTTIGPTTVATPSVTTTYTCTGFEPGPERVANGDFEQGNTGFTSSYQYSYDLHPEGAYYVDSDPYPHHENFSGQGHGGSGNFMIVNGATVPGTNVWTETVSVQPNTYYAFSTYVCTVCVGAEAQLQFSINGQQIGNVFSAPAYTNTWNQFYQIWNSGNSTSATITILNQNTTGGGNDFGLDDISFCELEYDSEAHCTIIVDALAATDDDASTCQGVPVDINVLLNDHLIQGCSSPELAIAQSPTHGTIVLLDDEIRYTPQADFSGNDSFSYRISCNGQNSTATVHVQVFATPNPTITADPNNVVVYGGTTTLTANPNATGAFNYQWTPADMVVDPNAATTATVPLFESTTFTVTVTNQQGGCQDSEDITVAVEGSSMTATASVDDSDICQDGSTTLHAHPVGGCGGNYTFSWSPASSLSAANAQNPVATPPLGTTTYSCIVSDGYSTQTVSVSVTVHPTEEKESRQTICSNDSIYFFENGYIHEPGVYVHRSHTDFGCDSVWFLTVETTHVDEVIYNVNLEEPDSICDHYYWNPKGKEFEGETTLLLTQSGDYQRTYQNSDGCDSIVNLHVDFVFSPCPSEISPINPHLVAPHWLIPATEFQINTYDYHIWETGAAEWDTVFWSLENANWLIEPNGNKGSCCRVTVLERVDETVWLKAKVVNDCSLDGVEKNYWLVCSFYDVDDSQTNPMQVEVFPNPNNGQMSLQYTGLQGKTSIKVYDIHGVLVDEFEIQLDGTFATESYSLPCRTNGMYLFVITNEAGNFYKKITVFN